MLVSWGFVRQLRQAYSCRRKKRLIPRKKPRHGCIPPVSTTEVALELPASRMALGGALDSMVE
jgi:hypothetical protein